jgi:hypothetical protein
MNDKEQQKTPQRGVKEEQIIWAMRKHESFAIHLTRRARP